MLSVFQQLYICTVLEKYFEKYLKDVLHLIRRQHQETALNILKYKGEKIFEELHNITGEKVKHHRDQFIPF